MPETRSAHHRRAKQARRRYPVKDDPAAQQAVEDLRAEQLFPERDMRYQVLAVQGSLLKTSTVAASGWRVGVRAPGAAFGQARARRPAPPHRLRRWPGWMRFGLVSPGFLMTMACQPPAMLRAVAILDSVSPGSTT